MEEHVEREIFEREGIGFDLGLKVIMG